MPCGTPQSQQAFDDGDGRLAWIIHDFAGGKRKGALKD
jgi:hypothetical protein